MKSSGVVSKQRVVDHGEVFTPSGLVVDMLNLVERECDRIDSRFLEPACGDGNFLAQVLRRKLLTVSKQSSKNRNKWERDAVIAVCSIYGIDLLPDNVEECRRRLLEIVADAHLQNFREMLPEQTCHVLRYVLTKNVVQGDALSLKNASGKPIVFAEWSAVNGTLIKRRDFKYGHLLDHAEVASTPLFSDLGHDVFLPEPAGEFAPCHYLKLSEQEEGIR